MTAIASVLLLQASVPAPDSAATKAPDPEADAREMPIVVTGETNADDEHGIQTGSRIPRKPRFGATQLNVRSSTGIGGLTPGSGMQPLDLQNPVTRTKISSCKSDNEAVGARAACILLNADTSIEAGDVSDGANLYRHLVSSDEFTPEERLAGGQRLYAFAQSQGDETLREEALIRLDDSGTLPAEKAQSARRALATMAIKRSDFSAAIARLEAVVANDPLDAQSHANLAILLRQEGREGAKARMAQAIAAREAASSEVPAEWRSF
ncbi:MAG: tetratricopeptide repeat protein [Marinomonas sp.]